MNIRGTTEDTMNGEEGVVPLPSFFNQRINTMAIMIAIVTKILKMTGIIFLERLGMTTVWGDNTDAPERRRGLFLRKKRKKIIRRV